MQNYHVKEDDMGGACSTYGGNETCVKKLAGKPEGKRLLGRPRRRWEGNIRMGRREID
jgi:hypothetical protein